MGRPLASILFSDGDVMGAVLDRNGLRPSRYYVTRDGYLILSSEVGVFEIEPSNVLVKERLHPGKMLLVDTVEGRIIEDEELKMKYAMAKPYGEWLKDNLVNLKEIKIPNKGVPKLTGDSLIRMQKVFGYSYEDVNTYIKYVALNEGEAAVAMGNDCPLPFLSKQTQPLFNYFKQLFAQVTNPPIDAIREEIVTSTNVYLGADGNLLKDTPENCKSLKVRNPILTNTDLLKIKYMNVPGFKVETVPMSYYKGTALKKALDDLNVAVERCVRNGANIIILSDRDVARIPPAHSVSACGFCCAAAFDTHKKAHTALYYS